MSGRKTDHTHDPALQSWVTSARGHEDFPIQNLPFGVFSPLAGAPRGGIAIGDEILDLRALYEAELLDDEAQAACETCTGPTLNRLLELGEKPRRALRDAVSALLQEGSDERSHLLHRARDCLLYLPAEIGDYTDFYAGIHHASAVGKQFRPENPLLPNYKYVPIGYHGRASSITLSGDVRRPNGQRKPAKEELPSYGPSRNLDYELELGIWVGPGNALGTTVPIAEAAWHIGGYCLLNDWSARDLQGWEYQPLGPFLAKSFHTTVSAWIVTPEALSPFRVAQPPRPEGDPAPLPYLLDPADQGAGALDLELEVLICTEAMKQQGLPPHRLSLSRATDLYWTPAQMLTHHASNGCNLRPGDLFGTGTISSPDGEGSGSLLEITQGGRAPVTLPSGETRRFLEDGDAVTLRARARRDGAAPIGFGECSGVILPAL
ncbi:MAG: fumarylacetoacetase [Myxococcales bacterium]|nr:fumarylacetoacetase [Myxococcales bacterium]